MRKHRPLSLLALCLAFVTFWPGASALVGYGYLTLTVWRSLRRQRRPARAEGDRLRRGQGEDVDTRRGRGPRSVVIAVLEDHAHARRPPGVQVVLLVEVLLEGAFRVGPGAEVVQFAADLLRRRPVACGKRGKSGRGLSGLPGAAEEVESRLDMVTTP